MASTIPASLKSHDLGRFATRAAQLIKLRPAISYWCNYYIVNQILSKSLHTTDEECTVYTTDLMDKLEEMKAQHATETAITDDLVAQAYVEQFGLETFARAENAMKANKVTNQTADTFYAAATFLELLQVWEKMTPEIHSRVKFAKHHALRIIKAIKAGEDPNASNPVVEPEPEEAELDPNDPEVQAINGTKSVYEQPSVADEASEGTHTAPEVPSISTAEGTATDEAPDPGYFPPVSPTSPAEQPPEVSPVQGEQTNSEPSVHPAQPPRNLSPPPTIPQTPADFYKTPTQPPVHTPQPPSAPPTRDTLTPRNTLPVATPRAPAPLAAPFQTPHIGAASPVAPPTPAPGVYNTDDAAVAAAQKHAKWAISALNFEDVPTAVKELREALKSLGTS